MRLSSKNAKSLAKAALFALLIAQPIASPVHADELAEREAIDSTVRELIGREDFAELERIANSFLNSKARTSSGLWKIGVFDEAIADAFRCKCSNDEFWIGAEENMKGWIKKYPESINAHLAYAHMLLEKAWSIRGWGYTDTVAPENWKPFHEQVEKARAFLMEHEAIGIADPRWNNMIVAIANLREISENEYEAVASAALDRHPDYYPIYFETMLHHLPKWGGSTVAIEKFAREAVVRSRAKEGHGMYARIYWYAAQSQYGNNLFLSSSVDWPEMKKGIDDVIKAYPDQWNINNFAKFACVARDREKTRELLDQMSGTPIPQAWGSQAAFENCREWALAEQLESESDSSLHISAPPP